jgi:hypothetical protein
MLALLFAVAVILLTVLALLLAGVLAAVVTGVVLLNVFATYLGARAHTLHCDKAARAVRSERWRPSSFHRPPEPPFESEQQEESQPLTIHRR